MVKDDMIAAAMSPLPDRVSGQHWMLPTRRFADGSRTGRVVVRFDGQGGWFLALMAAARASWFALSFQVVEPHPLADVEHDPRLGQVLIDGRTIRFGLMTTLWRRASWATVSTFAPQDLDGLVRALLRGHDLALRLQERSVVVRLNNFHGLFADALREMADPKRLPLARWLSG
jgi:hypothetical protein